MMPLRDYQERALERTRAAVAQKKKPVIYIATGAGKTRIAAEIFLLARKKGKRVAFVAPFISILNQTWKHFRDAGLDEMNMSLIQADSILYDMSKDIQICSRDTLVRRKDLPDVDIVIWDECHCGSILYRRWMEHAPNAVHIGLSASPFRVDMRKDGWDELIPVETMSNLIRQGYLSPYRLFAPSSPDMTGVKMMAGDFSEKDLSEKVAPQLIADVVKTYLEKGNWQPALCFCIDRAHAQSLCEQFNAAKIPAGYVDANTEVSEREELVEKLRTGELKVIANVNCFSAGLDAPFLGCVILARPTWSRMLYIQQLGRALRTYPGKTEAIILDHSGTALRLGFPDEQDIEDFLDGKKEKAKREEQKERLPKPCPSCSYLLSPKDHICPSCGFERKRASGIISADGELVEYNMATGAPGEKVTRDMKQVWYSSLLWIAQEKGYLPGWAANKYREKFGVWPRALDKFASYPDDAVRKFVKESQKAWIAERKKAETGGARI
jgi:superfamily II DNA or RNA helicase